MITVEINDSEVRAVLEKLVRAGGNLKPVMADIGEYLVKSTKERFAEGRGPDGNPWEANRESTLRALARRRAGATVRRPGEKLGRVKPVAGKKPLIGESKRLGNEIHYRVTANSVEIGSSLEYSAVQQFGARKGEFGRTGRGAPIPWGDIPARPFLGLSDADKVQVLDILREHLELALVG